MCEVQQALNRLDADSREVIDLVLHDREGADEEFVTVAFASVGELYIGPTAIADHRSRDCNCKGARA